MHHYQGRDKEEEKKGRNALAFGSSMVVLSFVLCLPLSPHYLVPFLLPSLPRLLLSSPLPPLSPILRHLPISKK
jgi:hypothetical protein